MSRSRTETLPEPARHTNVQRLVRDAPPQKCSTVAFPKLRGILVAMDDGSTRADPSPDQVNTPQMLFDLVESAEKHFKDTGGYDEDELRIFLAAEWYFRKSTGTPKTSLPYTHAEMLGLVDEIKTFSAQPAYKHWLIFPGTIYFGLGYTTCVAAAEDKSAIKDDIKKYFKVPGKGQTASPRPEPTSGPIVQWLVGNLGLAVYRGDVVHSHFKWIQQDIAERDKVNMPNATHIWAMNLIAPADARAIIGSSCFEINLDQYKSSKKLTFVYDICRDHKVGVGQGWCADQGAQADVHVVISNGVEVNKATIAARAGGHLLQCDGQSLARRLAWKVLTPPPLPDKTAHANYLNDVATTDAKIAFNTEKFHKWKNDLATQKGKLTQKIKKLIAENTKRKHQREVDTKEKEIQKLNKERTRLSTDIDKAQAKKEKLSRDNKKGRNDKQIGKLDQQIGQLKAKDKELADKLKEQFRESEQLHDKNELSGTKGPEIAKTQKELTDLEAQRPQKEKEMVGRGDSEAVKEGQYETAKNSVKTASSKELKEPKTIKVPHEEGSEGLLKVWEGRTWVDPPPDDGIK